jgi:hypothetical protein
MATMVTRTLLNIALHVYIMSYLNRIIVSYIDMVPIVPSINKPVIIIMQYTPTGGESRVFLVVHM